MDLKDYKNKRDFSKTSEPQGKLKKKSSQLIFVVQKHQASHLHYDFRLEMNGVLKSWAIPKGPSMNPKDKRLAIKVEDHPYDYKDFEGKIPAGNYGAGSVIIWDEGNYELIPPSNLSKGHLNFILNGKKLRGKFSLIKLSKAKENSWLLIKTSDDYATSKDILKSSKSVRSGITIVSKENRFSKKIQTNNLPDRLPSDNTTHIKPMLASLTDKPFSRKGWIFEIKWDGYRIIAYISRKKVSLITRNDQDYSDIFWPVMQELSKLNFTAILDGEMVVLDQSGRSNFQLLQQFQKTGNGQLAYMVFDLLSINGKDLRKLPLSKRKKLLKQFLPAMNNVLLSEHIATTGEDFFKVAVEHELEGIMAKDFSSPYLAGKRSKNWLKIKAAQRQEAIITGYTAPKGSRQYIGALILSVYKNKKLVYIGHTSGKLSEKVRKELKKTLDSLAISSCPLQGFPKVNSPVTWVKPVLVCEVAFTEWTQEEHLRQPAFIGLRYDKPAKSVFREEAINASETRIINHRRINLTNLTKVYWPQNGYTKEQLIEYYLSISKFILPYLKDRCEVLHRYPDGITGEGFFQKNIDKVPSWIKTKVFFSKHAQKSIRYILCQDTESLIYMVNLGCIEINPWLSRIKYPDNPDYCILDLDPENISFEAVILTAKFIHKILEKINIANYCKTSGKRGLHIYIPLKPYYSFEQSRQFAEIISRIVHRQLPDITSLVRSPRQRQGKVYIDCLQNRPHQTIVAPYSVRPTPGATVSTPIRWSEVTKRLDPNRFTMKSTLSRLEKIGEIWAEINKSSIRLEKSLKKIKKLI